MYTVIKAEHVSNDSVDEEYMFPDKDDNLTAYEGGYAQVMVPSGLLQNLSKWLYTYWPNNILEDMYMIWSLYFGWHVYCPN